MVALKFAIFLFLQFFASSFYSIKGETKDADKALPDDKKLDITTTLATTGSYKSEDEAKADLKTLVENAAENQGIMLEKLVGFEPAADLDQEYRKHSENVIRDALKCGKKGNEKMTKKAFAIVGVKKVIGGNGKVISQRRRRRSWADTYKLVIHYVALPTAAIGCISGSIGGCLMGCFCCVAKTIMTPICCTKFYKGTLVQNLLYHTDEGRLVGLIAGFGLIELPLTWFRPSKKFKNLVDELKELQKEKEDWLDEYL